MLRQLALLLVLTSACSARQARLETTKERLSAKAADPMCGPVGVRRAALASRWGEYLRVHVKTPALLTGEARLHVGARPMPLKAFAVTGDELVFEAPKAEAEALCALAKRVMEAAPTPAVSLSVPLTVEAKAGATWGAAH